MQLLLFMHMHINLSEYAEHLQLLSSVVFLFWVTKNCKSALLKKIENISRQEIISFCHNWIQHPTSSSCYKKVHRSTYVSF